MHSKLVLFVTILATCVTIGYSSECCTPYTDLYGTYHASQVCDDYCCWDVSVIPVIAKKTCCSNIVRRVPATDRDDCVTVTPEIDRDDRVTVTWIKERIWVPIVGTILFLAIVIGICTCCCCCACCAGCRTGSRGVVVQQGFGGPAHTVVVSSQQQQQQQQQMYPHPGMQPNPANVGYVQ